MFTCIEYIVNAFLPYAVERSHDAHILAGKPNEILRYSYTIQVSWM